MSVRTTAMSERTARLAEEEVIEMAAAMGVQLRAIHTRLFDMKNAWCPVILSGSTGEWWLSRQCLSNKVRRWRTVYRGPRLETALKHAKRWEEKYP